MRLLGLDETEWTESEVQYVIGPRGRQREKPLQANVEGHSKSFPIVVTGLFISTPGQQRMVKRFHPFEPIFING